LTNWAESRSDLPYSVAAPVVRALVDTEMWADVSGRQLANMDEPTRQRVYLASDDLHRAMDTVAADLWETEDGDPLLDAITKRSARLTDAARWMALFHEGVRWWEELPNEHRQAMERRWVYRRDFGEAFADVLGKAHMKLLDVGARAAIEEYSVNSKDREWMRQEYQEATPSVIRLALLVADSAALQAIHDLSAASTRSGVDSAVGKREPTEGLWAAIGSLRARVRRIRYVGEILDWYLLNLAIGLLLIGAIVVVAALTN
jgi:hypothetical protein